MNILILGATGFVGQYLSEYLKSIGNVYTLSRNSGDFQVDLSKSIDYCRTFGDLKFEVVINCATSYSPDPHESFLGNCVIAANILNCFKEHNCQIIFISSVSAMNENKKQSVYNYSKYLAEQTIQFNNYFLNERIAILRFGQIFDKARKAIYSQKGLYFFVDSINNGNPIKIFSGSENKRSYMPIDVLCDCVKLSINKELTGTFNIIAEPLISIDELVVLLENEAGVKMKILKDNSRHTISYFIPECSEPFFSHLKKIDVTKYLKHLIK